MSKSTTKRPTGRQTEPEYRDGLLDTPGLSNDVYTGRLLPVYAIPIPRRRWARMVVICHHRQEPRNKKRIEPISCCVFGPAFKTIREARDSKWHGLTQSDLSMYFVTEYDYLSKPRWKLIGKILERHEAVWSLPCSSYHYDYEKYGGYVIRPNTLEQAVGDHAQQIWVGRDAARCFPQVGYSGDGYVEDVAGMAIDQGWMGRRPYKGEQPTPICLDPWEVVKARYWKPKAKSSKKKKKTAS